MMGRWSDPTVGPTHQDALAVHLPWTRVTSGAETVPLGAVRVLVPSLRKHQLWSAAQPSAVRVHVRVPTAVAVKLLEDEGALICGPVFQV